MSCGAKSHRMQKRSFFKSQTGSQDEGRTRRQAERRTCLCHEEALPLEKQRDMQKQRPIAEAKNGKNSKPPRAERIFFDILFIKKEYARCARNRENANRRRRNFNAPRRHRKCHDLFARPGQLVVGETINWLLMSAVADAVGLLNVVSFLVVEVAS